MPHSARTWPALIVEFRGEAAAPVSVEDLVSALLDDFHPSAIEESPDAWRVFFADAGARDGAATALIGLDDRVRVEAVDVQDEDWAKRSQADLGPVVVGRLIVTPPWTAGKTAERADARSAEERGAGLVQVVILPSMGFGSGHHASTRLCLRLLQQVGVTGRAVVDVGTGSGILAIAARRLGAASVVAIDDDSDALESARENLALNALPEGADGVEILHGDFRSVPAFRADVILANLTAPLLARNVPLLAAARADRGCLIVSGLNTSDEAVVLDAFAPHAALAARLAEDDWLGLLLR
jgi:ribosomal protein L11 methyltransferase